MAMDPLLQKYLTEQMNPMDAEMMQASAQPDFRAEERAAGTQLSADMGRAGESIARAFAPGVQTGGDEFYQGLGQRGQQDLLRSDKERGQKLQMLKYLQARKQQATDKQATEEWRQKEWERSGQQHKERMEQKGLDRKQKEEQQKLKQLDKEKVKSTGQQKKMGLAKIGQKAEDQYRTAVNKGKKKGVWDPTSYGDWMDNLGVTPKWAKNDAAIEARAAMSSWGDSYLRDESGAAIPEAERSAYYEIYFPQLGDSPKTVENKSRLRWSKMNNAREAAGEEEIAYRPMDETAEPGTAIAGPGGDGPWARYGKTKPAGSGAPTGIGPMEPEGGGPPGVR